MRDKILETDKKKIQKIPNRVDVLTLWMTARHFCSASRLFHLTAHTNPYLYLAADRSTFWLILGFYPRIILV